MSARLGQTIGPVWNARRASACAVAALALGLAPAAAHAQWSAELTVERFHWREHISPIEVLETGPRFALGARYAQPRERGPLLAAYARVYLGAVAYDGSLQASPATPAEGTSSYVGATEGVELRLRWPRVADARVGIEFDQWRRRFSESQRETYQFVSARLGVEHVPTGPLPLLAGGGARLLLAGAEHAINDGPSGTYDVTLEPGLEASAYFDLGYRVEPRITLVAYWDGMRLGRSNQVALTQPARVVFQPRTDMDTIGLRVVYRFGPAAESWTRPRP